MSWGGLEAPGSRVTNPVGFCLQKLWASWVRQGSGRKEVGVVGLEEMDVSHPCLASVVGEIMEGSVGGWESERVTCFRFSNLQKLRDEESQEQGSSLRELCSVTA